jgi:hypothetical protein
MFVMLEAPVHLDRPPEAMDFVFYDFHFAGEFGDRSGQAGVNVYLRMLLLGELKEGFGGGCGPRANLNFRPAVGDDSLFHCEIGYVWVLFTTRSLSIMRLRFSSRYPRLEILFRPFCAGR